MEAGRSVDVSRVVAQLTDREREVYDLLLRASSDREIATQLGISTRTTRFHVSNVLSKFRIPNRLKLVHAVLSRR